MPLFCLYLIAKWEYKHGLLTGRKPVRCKKWVEEKKQITEGGMVEEEGDLEELNLSLLTSPAQVWAPGADSHYRLGLWLPVSVEVWGQGTRFSTNPEGSGCF